MMSGTAQIVAFCSMVVCGAAMAQNNKDMWSPVSAQITTEKISSHTNALSLRGLPVNQDDITPDQDIETVKLTEAERHQTQVWSLSPMQEKRYVLLMKNKSQQFWGQQHLSPVWVLGLNARSDEERHELATLAAQQAEQKIAKDLAWSHAYSQAYKELTNGVPLIKPFNVSKYSPYNYQPIVLQPGDVLNLFVSSKTAVRSVMSELLPAVMKTTNEQLNIYFVGKISDLGIQQWANQQNIPIDVVTKKQITLNHAQGRWQQLISVKRLKPPVLVLVRDGHARFVDTGRF